MKKFLKIFFGSIAIAIVLFISYFMLIRKLDNNAMQARDVSTATYDASQQIQLPVLFADGRFYLKLKTADGDTALAFGDSGGGISMALQPGIERLGLQGMKKTALLKGVMPIGYLPFYDVVKDKRIPPPMPVRGKMLRNPIQAIPVPYLIIPPEDDELKLFSKTMAGDFFLGQGFFMGHAWTMDYLHHELWVNTPLPATEAGKPGVQHLAFKKNNEGASIFGHGRMYIEVDGEVIEVLFDTGASIVLSEEGKKELNTTKPTLAGSFIATTIFDKWHRKHPDWKYFPKADLAGDVIEVPKITIGGHEVGPVLFARRQNEAWSVNMIGTMDKVVLGAIGGSALQYLKVTVDYNSELIRFEL